LCLLGYFEQCIFVKLQIKLCRLDVTDGYICDIGCVTKEFAIYDENSLYYWFVFEFGII